MNDQDDDFDDLLPFSPSTSLQVDQKTLEEQAGKKEKEEKKKVLWDPDEVIGGDGIQEEKNNMEGGLESDEDDDLQPFNLDDDMSDLFPHARQLYPSILLLYYNAID